MMHKITQQTRVDEILDIYPSLSRTFIEFGLPCLICGEPFWGTIEELGRQNNIDVNGLVEKLDERKKQIDEKP